IPDECDEGAFHRGDPNNTGTTEISDAITVFLYLFLGGKAPACLESADWKNDGVLDLSDGISILNFLFLGGPGPADPGPTTSPWALDPDPPVCPAGWGCESYEQCV